ncbi:MAG TPA: DUF2007 domain-containing protein [Candidatus Solibacter sp.]|nr:DUF2007 domain-containing protein [Candidatus Solibacter sp.]
MPDNAEFITVFRSADPTAEQDAADARARLAEAGIDAIVLGDDAPGVVEGTCEVRVSPSDQARADAVLAEPTPKSEDEDEVSEEGMSHDLDFVSIFSAQGIEAEMEAISIQSVLEANGIPCTVIGSAQIPSLPFEVRVPKSRLEEARSLLEEVRQAGAEAE